MGRFDGQAVVVSGGARGLGAACVAAFAQEGHSSCPATSSTKTVWPPPGSLGGSVPLRSPGRDVVRGLGRCFRPGFDARPAEGAREQCGNRAVRPDRRPRRGGFPARHRCQPRWHMAGNCERGVGNEAQWRRSDREHLIARGPAGPPQHGELHSWQVGRSWHEQRCRHGVRTRRHPVWNVGTGCVGRGQPHRRGTTGAFAV